MVIKPLPSLSLSWSWSLRKGQRRANMSAFMHRHASILLMLLAQLCSAILATIGRVLRTGSDDTNTNAMGTSEVYPPLLSSPYTNSRSSNPIN